MRATPAEPCCVFQEAWARPRVGAVFPCLLRMGLHKRARSPSGLSLPADRNHASPARGRLAAALTDPAVATRAPRGLPRGFSYILWDAQAAGLWKRCLPTCSRQGGPHRAEPGRWAHAQPEGAGDAPSCLPSPFPNLGPLRSRCPSGGGGEQPCAAEIGAFQGCWARIGLLRPAASFVSNKTQHFESAARGGLGGFFLPPRGRAGHQRERGGEQLGGGLQHRRLPRRLPRSSVETLRHGWPPLPAPGENRAGCSALLQAPYLK